MPGEKQRSYSRLYRLWRKIRFLYKRGTLFHSRRSISKPVVIQISDKRSTKRIYRRIKFLIRRKAQFVNSQLKMPSINPKPAKQVKDVKGTTSIIYSSYRKLRFLVRTGRLFKRKSGSNKSIPKRRKTLRRVRYLIYRGTLFTSRLKGNTPGKLSRFFNYIQNPNSVAIIVNSTALNLMAYLFIYLLIAFTTSLVSLSYDIESTISYYRILFFLSKSNGWVYDTIVNVFSFGPILALFISFTALFLYYKYKENHLLGNLFLIWVFLHGFTHFFGELLVGSIFFKGFGFAARYFFVYTMSLDILYFVILPSFFIMIAAGLLLGDLFLLSGNIYYNHIEKKNYNGFLSSQFLIPFILGNLIILLLKLPKIQPYEIFLNLSMGAVLIPAVINARSRELCLFDSDPRRISVRYLIVLAATLLLVGFRVLFEEGVRIG